MAFKSNYPYAVINGEVVAVEILEKASLQEPMIYEVIRVINGKPLFYQDHMARLKTSAELMNKSICQIETDLEAGVRTLISKLHMDSDNIKIVVGNWDEPQPQWLIFGVKGFYPPVEWYQEGVKATLFHELRHNPQAKVVNGPLAQRVDQLRETTNYFEALLVDEKSRITEGSRSNVVFIKDGGVVMPKAELALKGITKEKLLQAIEALAIPCKEADIKTTDLPNMEGVFITGTSIDLLPLREVDELKFETAKHPIMKQLLEHYRMLMEKSLNQFENL